MTGTSTKGRGAYAEVALGRPLTWQDIRADTRRRADELLRTDAEAAALEALRVATGETDGDMERHTVRQYLIAERLADTRGITFDRELLLCASFLHDAGLYGPASTGDVYIKDSVRYARRTLEPLGWPEDRLRVCLDACEQHHAFTARWPMGNEVELVRRSRPRRSAARARAVRHPSLLAQARAVAGSPARRLLARHPSDHSCALAANAPRHVPTIATAAN